MQGRRFILRIPVCVIVAAPLQISGVYAWLHHPSSAAPFAARGAGGRNPAFASQLFKKSPRQAVIIRRENMQFLPVPIHILRMAKKDSDVTRFGQLGGRNKKDRLKKTEKKSFPWWSIPAILLTLLLFKRIFFGAGDPSFVYYESSVYESSVYRGDGRVETSRKESFKSNIPSLVEDQQRRRQIQQNDDASSPAIQRLLEQTSSEEDSIMQDMDRMMR